MTVTINQVLKGLMTYIDTEILPHLTGVKKVGLGVYTALAANKAGGIISQYKEHPAVAMLDVVQGDNVDIERVYKAAVPYFENGTKYQINIPFIGAITVDRSDLDKLYNYITRG